MAEENEQESAVVRITARYVAELQAGKQPRLSDYLARYPQYADAISEFVTYYHAVEVDLQEEASPIALPPLSETSRVALARAWERLTPSTDQFTSWAVAQQVTLPQLAADIGLSTDIVEKLQRRLFDAATIPQEVLKRLAHTLQQPLSAIQTYFGLPGGLQIAEERASYRVGEDTKLPRQSFRAAIEQDEQLSAEQKAAWGAILVREGL